MHRKATAVRSHDNDRRKTTNTDAAPVPPEKRRTFPEPTLTKHDRVTKITLVSGDFTGPPRGSLIADC
jgi:hypothetical protein